MRQNDLRSGSSYWQATGGAAFSYPSLDGDLSCEVAVIGGGITGTLVAHALSRAGAGVVLVDREQPATGSTAASTGLLQYEVDKPLVELIDKVGRDHAVRSYRRGLEAIGELEAIATELSGDCGFVKRPALYLASNPEDVPGLREECDCRRHFGFDVQFLEPGAVREVCGLSAPGAIWSHGDGEINPHRFTQLVLQAATEQGARAFSRTGAELVAEDPRGVVVHTKRGQITARCAIYATGYAAHEQLRQDVGKLHTTYATVSKAGQLPAAWPQRCLIWETARPYFYARTLDEGRVMIGGEDTPGADDHEDGEFLEEQAQRLARKFKSLFPQGEFTPEHTWAGTFGETEDGLPFIGKLPGRERVFAALGYGGNGITFSMLAARLLTDLFLGKPNADAAAFRFGR